jgi:ribonuclease P protein component
LEITGIYTLKAKERLKRTKLIDELFSKGSYFTIPFFRVQYQLRSLPFDAPLQIGVSVSKRNFKKAVSRNRIKRLLREAVRLQKKVLSETLIQNKQQLAVFFIYTGKEIPPMELVVEHMTLILNRLIKLVNEKHISNT